MKGPEGRRDPPVLNVEVVAERDAIFDGRDAIHDAALAAEEPRPLPLQGAHLARAAHEGDLRRRATTHGLRMERAGERASRLRKRGERGR